MNEIKSQFDSAFSPWEISLPAEALAIRSRGKIVNSGWAIWYLFGSDDKGEYLDYYASHRMTDDRHVRIYASGKNLQLPTVSSFRPVSDDPDEDARLQAEYLAENQRVAEMLEAKGFGIEGDEPGGVQMNRALRLRNR